MMNNTLYVGSVSSPIFELGGSHLKSISCELVDDLISSSLPYDKLTVQTTNAGAKSFHALYDSRDSLLLDSVDSVLMAQDDEAFDYSTVPAGTPCWWYNGGALVGKFFWQTWQPLNEDEAQLTLISAIGLLDAVRHVGGVYTGKTWSAVLAELMPSNIPYTVQPTLATQPVYGWLPYVPNEQKKTARTNLRELLFAQGAAVTKDADGDLHFGYLTLGQPSEIADTVTYRDDDSITEDPPATAVEVVEHTYAAFDTDETVTLYDNTNGSGTSERQTVIFRRAPCHSLTTSESLTIVEQGANYAVVEGMGVLTGKVYSHLQNVLRQSTGASGEAAVASVTDATLVSVVNSRSVLARLTAWYASPRTITTSFIVRNGERPNKYVNVLTAKGIRENAIIMRMRLEVSSKIRATAELRPSYTPTGQGNNYAKCTVYAAGTAAITLQKGDRVVLIGGGSGGQSGGNGTRATGQGFFWENKHGDGGAAGKGGVNGKVYAFTAPSAGTYAVSIGVGGDGGVAASESGAEPVDGADGGATTITINDATYSTESGTRTQLVRDFVNGVDYAVVGIEGVAGGDGCDATSSGADVVYNGRSWRHGARNETVAYQEVDGIDVIAYGGYGGGAAVGSNGGDGHEGYTSYNGGNGWAQGGTGGDGANGENGDDAAVYGSGGNGGHGGGGAGAGGGAAGKDNYFAGGSGGSFGRGGNGGKGADGCILVYSM